MLAFVAATCVVSRPCDAADAPVTVKDTAFIAKTVSAIVKRHPMRTAQLGVAVIEVRTGRRIFMRQAEHEFAPASNFKLLDAATALAYLGAGFRYHTELLARGPVSGGVLNGDLILVGGGDPVLTRGDVRAAAAAVKAAGIQTVGGSVLADGAIFDGQRYGSGWAWDDMPYYYQPPIQALAVDEGTVGVTAAPGTSVGAAVSTALERDPGSMSIFSTATTSAAHGPSDVDCFRSPGSTTITIVGHVRLGSRPEVFRCAVEDANEDAVAILRQALQDAGVTAGVSPRGPAPANIARDVADDGPAPPPVAVRYPGATTVWEHASPTVAELIKRMMPPSDNFIAEHLFKMLPLAAWGRRGSFEGGAAVERRFIASLGFSPDTIDNGDGSGLSQGDRITPLDIAALLRWEATSKGGGAFVHSLAKAGINGTVRKHLRGTDAVGRVLAKDGYIWHVSTFSGYAQSKRHGTIVFSVMFNDANGSLKPFLRSEDEIVKAIVDMP